MKRMNRVIAVTAAGLLLATGAAGASGLSEKVKAILHKEISVAVNGSATSMHPVYIDGKAYLPVRDTANALGLELKWNGRVLELNDKEQPAEEQYLRTSGVVVSATEEEGRTRLEVLGHGPNTWIILYADRETVITGEDGKPALAKDIKPGMSITAQYGPIIALSFPGQSHAATIQLGTQRLIQEGPAFDVKRTDDGWQLQFSELKEGVDTPTLTLTAGKETMLVTSEGLPVEWTQIKAGTKVRAYYGPIMTKSIPPQSPAHVIVVLDEGLSRLDPATVKEYRDLAWTFVPESEKSHLITKKDEAQVSLVKAEGAAIMPANDKMKQVLADLAAKDGQVVSVLYNTDQDALIGPLVAAIHPETKELIGFFQRL